MSAATALVVAAVACMLATAALIVGVISSRFLRNRRAAAVAQRRAVLRPLVLSWMEPTETGMQLPPARRDRRLAIALAVELIAKLRGADRDQLVGLLGRAGAADAARRDTGSRRAVTRLRAAVLLDMLARPDDLDRLIELTMDSDFQVRVVAVRAIGRVGMGSAAPVLIRGLTTRRLPVHAVSMAIVRIGASAAPALEEALRSSDPRTRALGAELLGYIGVSEASFELIDLLDDDEHHVVTAAAHALGRLQQRLAVPNLMRRLVAEHALSPLRPAVCMALVEALGRIGDRQAIPVLTASLGRSTALSHAASAALRGMGPRRSGRSDARRRAEQAEHAADRSPVLQDVEP